VLERSTRGRNNGRRSSSDGLAPWYGMSGQHAGQQPSGHESEINAQRVFPVVQQAKSRPQWVSRPTSLGASELGTCLLAVLYSTVSCTQRLAEQMPCLVKFPTHNCTRVESWAPTFGHMGLLALSESGARRKVDKPGTITRNRNQVSPGGLDRWQTKSAVRHPWHPPEI
jgi:hypothetical protein